MTALITDVVLFENWVSREMWACLGGFGAIPAEGGIFLNVRLDDCCGVAKEALDHNTIIRIPIRDSQQPGDERADAPW